MGQPRIVEVDYHDFCSALKDASDANLRVEKSDKVRWKQYVRQHKVPEGGMEARARAGAMSGKLVAVIINGSSTHDGYYFYSDDDLFCLKYESGKETPPPPAADPPAAEAPAAEEPAAEAQAAESPATEAPAPEPPPAEEPPPA